MSDTIPHDQVAAAEPGGGELIADSPWRARFRWLVLGALVVLVAGGLAAWRAGVFSPAGSSGAGRPGAAASTAAVVRTTLTTTEQVGGAIGYGGSYTITAPSPGSTSAISQDQQTLAQDQQGVSQDQQSVTQDRQAVTQDQQTLSADRQAASDTSTAEDQTVAADQANVSTDQSTLNADQAKETADCAVTSSAATGPDTTACTTDEQQVRTDKTTLTTAQQQLAAAQLAAKTADDQAQAKVRSDQAAVRSAQAEVQSAQAGVQSAQVKVHGDQAALATLLATEANPGTTYTWLPAVGQVIRQDQPVYAVSGEPVPLLYGAIPAYRAFHAGVPDGADVGELTHDLIALGYGAGLTQSNHYSAATAASVARWQTARGLPATGEILLGEVVFEPGPIRVTSVTPASGASVGGSSGSATVLTATSVTPVVTVALDVTEEYLVKPGDAVTVVLPAGTTTVGGQVETVGTVATCPGNGTTGNGSGGETPCSSSTSSSTPTVTVTITLDSTPPGSVLDQAPVNVNITSQRVTDVLAVPVGALVAQPGGGYAVEVAGPGNTRRWVPVTVGLSDDANGLVQVTGNLTPGAQVVVSTS
jgi:multidrug efflux pump subunit AcrA (membrane-fusion protein)